MYQKYNYVFCAWGFSIGTAEGPRNGASSRHGAETAVVAGGKNDNPYINENLSANNNKNKL